MSNLLTIIAVGLTTLLPTADPLDAVERAIDAEMPASAVPGVAYAVAEDGDITAAGARGVVELGTDTPVTADTPFQIGSISKSFTAVGVLQLVESGEVELDAELATYLEEFDGKAAGDITIRQLLSHTSGFSTFQGNDAHAGDGTSADALERQVAGLVDTQPANAPGERWEYSNTNYQILGRVIEVVSGRSFQDYITAGILDPVGMPNSFVADGDVHPEMATPHRPWFWGKIPLHGGGTDRATAPQGGIVASANDLARYLSVLLNESDDIITAEHKALMMQPANDASPFYGLGWYLDTSNGVVSHGGNVPGAEALATMLPAEGKAAVVLVNGGSGMALGDTAQLRNAITDAALGTETATGGPGIWQQLLFLGLVLLPISYLLSMLWAWLRRPKLRAKTRAGFAGAFSLWFPLLTTLVAAWVILALMPSVIGSPLGTLARFQPDLGVVLVASAATGVVWAAFRLVVGYSGRSDASRPD